MKWAKYPSTEFPYAVSANKDRSSFYHDRSFRTYRLAKMAADRAVSRGYNVRITHHDFSDPYVGKSQIVHEDRPADLDPWGDE